MTDQGSPNPAPVTPSVPAGWHVNPSSGQREWWDGANWGTPPAKPPVAPLAIIALILGGVAFLFGLVPIFGLLVAIAGVVVSILALVRKAKPSWMAAVGIGLSGIALLTGLVVMVTFFAGLAHVSTTATGPLNPITTAAPKPSEPAEASETPEPVLPLAQQQAVAKAQSYLEFQSFSRKGLIEQLEFEGFDKADAVFGVDYLNVDWNDQAAKKAAEYLNGQSFSKKSLTEQLIFEGFTKEQAAYGVKSVGF